MSFTWSTNFMVSSGRDVYSIKFSGGNQQNLTISTFSIRKLILDVHYSNSEYISAFKECVSLCLRTHNYVQEQKRHTFMMLQNVASSFASKEREFQIQLRSIYQT